MTRTFAAPLLLTLLALSCQKAPLPAPARSSAPPASSTNRRAKADVVVTLVVDQLGAWMAAERWPVLPRTGGFARLLQEGTYVKDARHEHACTDTAPGHAALYTGAPPRVTGIFGNEVIDETTRKRVSILRDAAVHVVGEGGERAEPGSSIARLRVETLADRLKAERPEAMVISLSLKDRGAIFGGGRHPDAVAWFDSELDAFVTSTAFARSLPRGVAEQGGNAAILRTRSPWTPLDPTWLSDHAGTPDQQQGEGDWHGFGTVFPHDVALSKKPGVVFRASPSGDERLFALAGAMLDDPRVGEVPTLLALSMSTHDYVSHIFGPDSWESWDQLERLDAALSRFLELLDARFGTEGWSLVLSADHGAINMPETATVAMTRPFCAKNAAADRWTRGCEAGGRILLDDMTSAMREEAARVMGPGDFVLGTADPYLYLTETARALPQSELSKLVLALRRKLLADPRVARVLDVRSVPSTCPGDDDESVDALICRAVPERAPGALYVATKPGFFFDADYVPGKGTSHGTPYLYDRAVPIVVRAPGRATASAVVDDPLSASSFVRTASALLGIGAPEAATGGRSLLR